MGFKIFANHFKGEIWRLYKITEVAEDEIVGARQRIGHVIERINGSTATFTGTSHKFGSELLNSFLNYVVILGCKSMGLHVIKQRMNLRTS